MRHLKKTLLLLSLLMFVAQARSEGQPEVTYIDCSWDGDNKVVKTQPKTITDYVVFLNSSTLTLDNDHRYWVVPAGTTVTVSDAITINGDDVHIILCNDSKLICKGGIIVEGGNKIHIHGTSPVEGMAVGQLNVSSKYKDYAGIGGGKDKYTGDIFIHGGDITATGGDGGAGIGVGASENEYATGHVTIYGGKVTATGGDGGAGIGSGYCRSSRKERSGYAHVTIYGGEIYAFGSWTAAGIGTGQYGHDYYASVDIYGGTIYAEGGDYASGIGGGYNSGGGRVCIHKTGASNYFVEAKGGKKGAGIGSGEHDLPNKLNSYVLIEDAVVEATGGAYGAGIGLGHQHGPECDLDIIITGGKVTAYGGTDAAGIGAGENQTWFIQKNNITVHIGGTADVKAVGKSYGAGIGGGEDSAGSKLTIDGQATVEAIAGDDCNANEKKGGAAIGSGDISFINDVDDKESISGDFSIASDFMVFAGASATSTARFDESGRVSACRWNNYARIEPCNHGDFTYTIDEDTHHTKHCRYCQYTQQEEHSYTKGECLCGRSEDAENTYYSVMLSTASGVTDTGYSRMSIRKCISGRTFVLPTPEEIDGLTFMGWQAESGSGTYKYLLKDDETLMYKAGDKITIEGVVHLYARYIYKAKSLQWNWSDDYTSATLTINIRGTISTWGSPYVTVSAESKAATESEGGYVRHTATATRKLEGHTYTFTDEVMVPSLFGVAIADAADNTTVLHDASRSLANTVTLDGRTLYKDGSWNALCLPFSLTADQVAASILADADIRTLGQSRFENGTLTLDFTPASTIEAGKPYLVKWDAGTNIENPEFHNVTIDDTYPEGVNTQYVSFLGSFSPVGLAANDHSVLYLGAGNKLYYPSVDMNVNSCRAYFQLDGIIAGDLATAVAAFRLNFNDAPTGITSVSQEKASGGSGWYTLDGRRLSGKPHSRGVYVCDGKKVVIK